MSWKHQKLSKDKSRICTSSAGSRFCQENPALFSAPAYGGKCSPDDQQDFVNQEEVREDLRQPQGSKIGNFYTRFSTATVCLSCQTLQL